MPDNDKKERVRCHRRGCDGSCPPKVVAKGRQEGGTPAKCRECGTPFRLPPGHPAAAGANSQRSNGNSGTPRGNNKTNNKGRYDDLINARVDKIEKHFDKLTEMLEKISDGQDPQPTGRQPRRWDGRRARINEAEDEPMEATVQEPRPSDGKDEDAEHNIADLAEMHQFLLRKGGESDPATVAMAARLREARAKRDREKPLATRARMAEQKYKKLQAAHEKEVAELQRQEDELSQQRERARAAESELAEAAADLADARAESLANCPKLDKVRHQTLGKASLSDLIATVLHRGASDDLYAGMLGGGTAEALRLQLAAVRDLAANFEAQAAAMREQHGGTEDAASDITGVDEGTATPIPAPGTPDQPPAADLQLALVPAGPRTAPPREPRGGAAQPRRRDEQTDPAGSSSRSRSAAARREAEAEERRRRRAADTAGTPTTQQEAMP